MRLVRFLGHVKADMTDHMRGAGFFTVVAGTCALGSQLLIVAGQEAEAAGLCFLITLSILRWWRPTSSRKTSTGYIRASKTQDR